MRALAAVALALTVPSLALAATIDPGRYTGKTKRGVTMRLRVTSDQHVDYRLGFRARCDRGRRRPRIGTSPLTPPKLRDDGTFRDRERGTARNEVGHFRYRERIRGRVTDSTAKGSYSGVIHYDNGRTCKAKDVRWAARRR
jgi:hypothetical protein